MALLLDLSNNNSAPNWAQVKSFGVVGCFLKASEGVHFVDGTFAFRRNAAAAHGIRTGAYHFARPDASSPVAQADAFCSVVHQIGPRDLRPVLDLEAPTTLTSASLVAWARAFNQEVKLRLGVLPLFYSYSAYITSLRASKPIGAGLWLAAYSRNDGSEHPYTVPSPWKRAVAHQFSSQCRVLGCANVVDLSHAATMLPLLAHPVASTVRAPLAYLGRH